MRIYLVLEKYEDDFGDTHIKAVRPEAYLTASDREAAMCQLPTAVWFYGKAEVEVDGIAAEDAAL